MAQSVKLAVVSNVYRTENYRFVDAYLAWLEEAENDLSGTRSHICILLQAEKTSLTSVLDGYRPHNVEVGKNVRKSQRAVAAQSLERVSREIYSTLERIDHTLGDINEKLCHAVAVLASKNLDVYDKLELSQSSIDTIWLMLSTTPETIPMFNYLCAKLTMTDRNYLLMDIIQNIVSNKTATHAQVLTAVH